MTVYCVFEGKREPWLVCIFANPDKAQEYIDKYKDNLYEHYFIEPHEVLNELP